MSISPADVPEHPADTVLSFLREHWDDQDVLVLTRSGEAAVIDERPLIVPAAYQNIDRDRMVVAIPSSPEQDDGYDALDSATGKLMQRIDSAGLYCDAVAGSAEDCRGITADGRDANPSRVATALHRHIQQLLLDATHVPPLRNVSAGTSNRLVDSDAPDPIWRAHFRISYQTRRRPSPDA